jgi:hypothetical protein
MNYAIIFWHNSSYGNKVFKLQKRNVRITIGSISTDSCQDFFKNLSILTLTSQIHCFPLTFPSLLCFVITNRDQYLFNSGIHGRDTRQIKKLYQPISNLFLYQTGILNSGIKIYNNLPPFLKRASYNSKEVKSLLRNFLYSNPVCKLDEYVDHKATAWWLCINILALAL